MGLQSVTFALNGNWLPCFLSEDPIALRPLLSEGMLLDIIIPLHYKFNTFRGDFKEKKGYLKIELVYGKSIRRDTEVPHTIIDAGSGEI